MEAPLSPCYHHEDISKESKPGTFLKSSDSRADQGLTWHAPTTYSPPTESQGSALTGGNMRANLFKTMLFASAVVLVGLVAASPAQAQIVTPALATYKAAPIVGPSFDTSLTDNSTGNLLQWNSTTGEYKFTRSSDGFMITGTGVVKLVNGIRTLTDFKTDRRISASFNTGQLTGNATLYLMVAQGVWQGFWIVYTPKKLTFAMPACPIKAFTVPPTKRKFTLPIRNPLGVPVSVQGTVQVTDQTSSTVLLLSVVANADLTRVAFARTVKEIAHATGQLTFDRGCTSSDPYGSNNCTWMWGDSITAGFQGALQEDLQAGKLIVDLKIDNTIPFSFNCRVCGDNCTITIPGQLDGGWDKIWPVMNGLIRFSLAPITAAP